MKKQNNRTAPRSNQLSGDERIVNRTNQRRKRIRRKKIVFRSVLCLLFLIAGVIISLTMFFNIDTVTVTGDAVYSEGDVITASEVLIGDNLIFLSKSKVSERIVTKLPYVGSVTIKRHLPNGIELQIHKTDAAYAIANNGYYTLLDKNAKVLENNLETIGENIVFLSLGEVVSAEPGKTIVLGEPEMITKLAQIGKALEQCELVGITSMDLSNIHNIKLIYQGRIILELGETDATLLQKKLSLGKNAIETQDEENKLYRGQINLTVEGKAYWKEENQTPETTTEPESETEALPENTENPTSEPVSESENTSEKPGSTA